MAYFGRKPKKPGSVPRSQSGVQQNRHLARSRRAAERVLDRGRPERPGREFQAVREARSGRSAR